VQPNLRVPAFLAGAGLGIAVGFLIAQALPTWLEPDVARYREARDYVKHAFVREVDDAELMDAALHGLADHLDDYSAYYDPTEAAQLERETSGRYNGLGVAIGEPFRDGRILFPLAGGPAQAAGLRPGDRFVRVAGRPFSEVDPTEFRRLVQTSEPRDVELVVEGLDGVERGVVVHTGSVVEPTVRHECLLDAERGVGYLAITSFSRETYDEFTAAFERLRGDGMRGLVLDLRGNPGGLLLAAIGIARAFVPEGLIVSTEGRGVPVMHSAERAAARYVDFPLVVLVDERSASASEVLASALQEHRAGVLVGGPTYGKGMVQTMHRFDADDSVMKVTTSYYYTPSHQNLEHSADPAKPRGIQPDLAVLLPDAEREALHVRLNRPCPPREYLDAIAAWEAEEDIEIVPPPRVDAQVAAALDLFAGKRPGPVSPGTRSTGTPP